MNRKRWLSIGGILLIVVILVIFLASVLKPDFSSASELTEQDAIAIAEQRYRGIVKAISQKKNQFVIEMERGTGIYELQLDIKTGEVLSLNRIENKEDKKVVEEEKPNEDIKMEEENVNTAEKKLTEAEAIEIALQQVPGTVDDVDEENINGILYFLVEIESNDGGEATVEINSITRNIESLTWDDQEDDDD